MLPPKTDAEPARFGRRTAARLTFPVASHTQPYLLCPIHNLLCQSHDLMSQAHLNHHTYSIQNRKKAMEKGRESLSLIANQEQLEQCRCGVNAQLQQRRVSLRRRAHVTGTGKVVERKRSTSLQIKDEHLSSVGFNSFWRRASRAQNQIPTPIPLFLTPNIAIRELPHKRSANLFYS